MSLWQDAGAAWPIAKSDDRVTGTFRIDNMNDEKYEAPKQSKGDVAHSIVKAGLSSVPVIGSAAAELFQNVVQPPLEKRRIQWMDQVGKKLTELEENGLKLEELQENEQFISAAMHASQIALRNHQSEKLESLRNALEVISKPF
jgi:hypothetical protein